MIANPANKKKSAVATIYLFKKNTTTIVTITFAKATGSKNFQPKFIS